LPVGKGGFLKIGLSTDIFTQKLWGFKSKAATGKTTMDNLKQITQPFIFPHTLMVDGGSHFDCEEVRDYCASIGTKHHVVTAHSPWINGLLEGYNRIFVEALKHLCALGLGQDDYECMRIKDIPSNWPNYLDIVIKNLNNHILPSLKYSPNELMLDLIVNSQCQEP
jgi:hypothetical protein